jgi:hypothetical protein
MLNTHWNSLIKKKFKREGSSTTKKEIKTAIKESSIVISEEELTQVVEKYFES